MKQRTVIRFLTLKSLRASAIAAELEWVYETEALAISPVKKWCKRFAEGKTVLYDDPKCGRPPTNDLADAVSSMLKEGPYLPCKVLCRRFHTAKGIYLRVFIDMLGIKSSIFFGFPMTWTRIRRPKDPIYHMEFFRYHRAFVLLVSRVSSREINHGSLYAILMIRYGRRHEMHCQKESIKK
jgi:hypothetical protein